ncbi:MAG: hypothetical protein ACRYF7_16665 [Janthinobacterium lividum]|uniref:Transmembrane protein n=1 Tax=Massilia varians TaxID=457921 RepID=A0ABM8C3R2_9BURK|nr:hypothetical protein [Massilia varians]BDT57833.1 hypothetical protein MasN3_13270 [Massilia varians]
MKPSRFDTFMTDMKDIARKANRALRSGARTLASLSWPSLLAVSIGLALILSIVPLALTLFIAFLLLKVVATALFGRRPAQLVE